MTAHKNGFFGDKDNRLPLRRGRGKRRKFKVVLAFFSLFFFVLFGMSGIAFAYAEESSDGKEELNQNIIDQIDKLDTEELQKYIDSLGIFSDENIGERLFDYIRGEKFDYGRFGEQILGVLFEDVKNMLPAFACICAVALLCGILSSVKSSFADQSSADIIFLVAYAAALIPVLAVLTGVAFSRAGESISSMQKQMQIVFPLLLTLMAASGGSVSAAIYQPAVAFLSTTIVSVVSAVVLPLTLTIIAFSVAGNLSSELKLNNFSAFFKSINKWIIGVCVSVFGIFFTVQGLTSATYDGITRRRRNTRSARGCPSSGAFSRAGSILRSRAAY